MSRNKIVANTARPEPIIYSRDEHNISRKDIDPDALKIMYRLAHSGYQAFLVGGGVRDLLLNKKPKDFDISTDATPRQIKSLFRNSRIIGRRFKLVHIFFHGNKNIEVSTFRAADTFDVDEEESGALRDDNVYGDEASDALRRDLTINGLFYDISSFSVIDYVGGMNDLRSGTIRIIGNPDVRFKEDPVRLMRTIRHAARNDFDIDRNCWESLIRNRGLIGTSSPMRVYEELKKDLTSGHFLKILKLLNESGLLEHLLPEMSGFASRLLSPEHNFFRALLHIDKQIREGAVFSATTVLAVLVYFSRDLLAQKYAKEYIGELEAWSEVIKDILVGLSVPRKERERVEAVLDLSEELFHSDLSRVKPHVIRKRNSFNEVMQFVSVLVALGAPNEVLLFLNKVDTTVPEFEHNERVKKRRSYGRQKQASKQTGLVKRR
jgi:poly(A) polymerase